MYLLKLQNVFLLKLHCIVGQVSPFAGLKPLGGDYPLGTDQNSTAGPLLHCTESISLKQDTS